VGLGSGTVHPAPYVIFQELNRQQKEDPLFYQQLGKSNSEWYKSLNEEQKIAIIAKKTNWLKNEEKVLAARKKKAETCKSISICSEKFGGGIVAAIREMRDTGRNLTIFKGFVFEVYNKEIHTFAYDTDITKLAPLKSKRWNPKSAVKSSDGQIFLSISEAADSFGERKTDSTADWISRCIKSNRDAMGFYWSRPTTEECEQKIISLLNEQRESFG
jgi:hypothetical protein